MVCNGAQAGIVSFGLQCALPQTPAVYVDIASYILWLRNVTRLELSSANVFSQISVTLLLLCTSLGMLR